MNPALDPALDYVRGLPWAPSILVAGAAAVLCAWFALTRRRTGESSLAFGVLGIALGLILAELGKAGVGMALIWVALTLGTGVALVADTARAIPGAPRTAPGNQQRLLGLGVVGLLVGAWVIAALAVDWPSFEPAILSTLGVAGAVGAVGLVGVLTRRHWLAILLAGEVVVFALVVAVAAFAGPEVAGSVGWPGLLLLWGWAAGFVGLALVYSALVRGHGPWVEPLEEERL